VADTPVIGLAREACWLNVELALGFTKNSLYRALSRSLEELGSMGIAYTGRRRKDPGLIFGIWSHYRRLSEPGIQSSEMAKDLDARLQIKHEGRTDSLLDKQRHRFRSRLTDVEKLCRRHQGPVVHFLLGPDGQLVARTTRQ
jgi:hypothetical protein